MIKKKDTWAAIFRTQREGIFFTLYFQKQSDAQMLTFKLCLPALGLLLAFPGQTPNPSLPSGWSWLQFLEPLVRVGWRASKHYCKGKPASLKLLDLSLLLFKAILLLHLGGLPLKKLSLLWSLGHFFSERRVL